MEAWQSGFAGSRKLGYADALLYGWLNWPWGEFLPFPGLTGEEKVRSEAVRPHARLCPGDREIETKSTKILERIARRQIDIPDEVMFPLGVLVAEWTTRDSGRAVDESDWAGWC
jgi:hypothetical protein